MCLKTGFIEYTRKQLQEYTCMQTIYIQVCMHVCVHVPSQIHICTCSKEYTRTHMRFPKPNWPLVPFFAAPTISSRIPAKTSFSTQTFGVVQGPAVWGYGSGRLGAAWQGWKIRLRIRQRWGFLGWLVPVGMRAFCVCVCVCEDRANSGSRGSDEDSDLDSFISLWDNSCLDAEWRCVRTYVCKYIYSYLLCTIKTKSAIFRCHHMQIW